MQTSLLVVPQAFIECEVRVYDKRRLKDRAKDDEESLRYYHSNNQCIHLLLIYTFIRDALISWKRNAEIKHNGASGASHALANQNET